MKFKSFIINVSCALLLSGCTLLTVDSDDASNATFSAYDNGNLEQREVVNQHDDLLISQANNDLPKSNQSALLIPDDIANFMSTGVSVSAFVSNLESGVISKHSFGDIIVSYHDGSIWLVKIENLNNEFPLTENAQSSLLELKDVKFDRSGRLVLSELISMHLDIESMEITVNVDPSLMAVSNVKEHEIILKNSSVDDVTDLLSYSVYSNSMNSSMGSSRRDNIQFDNIASWKEHHVNTSGFIANGTDDEQRIELDKLTYEFDAKGYRFDAGMKSGWSSVQSLGDVTTLNGQKVYGAAFGNVAKSAKFNSRQALVPIVVYMPGNGEAKVFRDGRILDIQRLEMGNKELDTENFPVGVYDVDVEVSVGGRTVSKRTYQVNKPAGTKGSHGSELSWELWGGMMELQESRYVNAQEEEGGWGEYQQSTRMAPLVGLSMGSNWHGIDWAATAYNNDKTQVSEWHADWKIDNNYSLYTQVLAATDGATGILARADATFFDGVINLWLASERKSAGSRLTTVYDTSLDSTGASLSLYEATGISGSLAFSYQQDHEYNSRYWSADYSHSFYFEEFGSWMLQVGTNKQYTKNDYSEEKLDQYYASLSVSLPFDGNLMFGVSKNGASDVYNISGSTNVDLGPVTYIGTDVSMTRTDNVDTVTSYSGYLGYDTRYLDGSLSYSGSANNSSVSLSGRGALAIDNAGISAGSGHGDAGIVVDVPENIDDGGLIATVNQSPHELHSGRNLVLVPAYNDYTVNISSNLESEKSYQVEVDDNQYTLYPGNVVPMSISAKSMVTVFGRLKNMNGESLANIPVKNHIGMTTTDSEGNFAIDVDSAFPEIIVEVTHDDKFKVEMELMNNNGTALVGDIQLNAPPNDVYKIRPIG